MEHDIVDTCLKQWAMHREGFLSTDPNPKTNNGITREEHLYYGNYVISFACIKLLFLLFQPILIKMFPEPETILHKHIAGDHQNILRFLQFLRRKLFMVKRKNENKSKQNRTSITARIKLLRQKARSAKENVKNLNMSSVIKSLNTLQLRQTNSAKETKTQVFLSPSLVNKLFDLIHKQPTSTIFRKNLDYAGPHLGMFQLQVDRTASCIDQQIILAWKMGTTSHTLDKGLLIQAKPGSAISHVGTTLDPDSDYTIFDPIFEEYVAIATVHDPKVYFDILTTAMIFRVNEYIDLYDRLKEIKEKKENKYSIALTNLLLGIQDETSLSHQIVRTMQTTRTRESISRSGKTFRPLNIKIMPK